MRLSNSRSFWGDIRDIVRIVHNIAKNIGMAVMANEVDEMLHAFEVNGGYREVPIRENNFVRSCARLERIGNANSGTRRDYQHRTNLPLAIKTTCEDFDVFRSPVDALACSSARATDIKVPGSRYIWNIIGPRRMVKDLDAIKFDKF